MSEFKYVLYYADIIIILNLILYLGGSLMSISSVDKKSFKKLAKTISNYPILNRVLFMQWISFIFSELLMLMLFFK